MSKSQAEKDQKRSYREARESKWRARQEHVATLPNQAAPGERYFVVLNTSPRYKETITIFYRHATSESAKAEAVRLSELRPGDRFSWLEMLGSYEVVPIGVAA